MLSSFLFAMRGFKELKQGVFVEKKNRFLAMILINGESVEAHIPNTGRLKELLFEGNRVLMSYHGGSARKTSWSIRYAEKDGSWISIDSQLPNALIDEAIREKRLPELSGYELVKREAVYRKSRFDFLLKDSRGGSCYLEVKGVTLEKSGKALFPDAETERGIRHLRELGEAKKSGIRAMVIFVVQLDHVRIFSPNPDNPNFCEAFSEAKREGVEMYAYKVKTGPEEIRLDRRIKIAPQF